MKRDYTKPVAWLIILIVTYVIWSNIFKLIF